jgi:hypothetical protein
MHVRIEEKHNIILTLLVDVVKSNIITDLIPK